MKLLFVLSLLALNATAIYCSQRVKLHSKFFSDLIKHETLPVVLFGKLCWSVYEQMELAIELAHPLTFLKSSEEIPKVVGADQNKVWFFVDMTCEDSADFLQTVDKYHFSHPFRWILLQGKSYTFTHYPFLPDSNIITTDKVDSMSFNLTQGSLETFHSRDTYSNKELDMKIIISVQNGRIIQ